jgi:myo-inositol-1(or 4)-monophosphatase
VAEAGELASSYSRRGALDVRFKADRSVVTAADRAVEALLRAAIQASFSNVNILGEEGGAAYDPSRPYTFTIDPIDGTAAFATRMPGWAICIGVLNQALQPIAGIVSAPSWQSLFVVDVDPTSPATLNDVPLATVAIPADAPVEANTTILVDSKLFQTHYMRGFPGKCRSVGSTALHICLVAQHTGMVLAHACSVYPWDIVAAHAIAARVGLTVQYLDGAPLVYHTLLPDKPSTCHVVAGHAAMLATICPCIVPLPPHLLGPLA